LVASSSTTVIVHQHHHRYSCCYQRLLCVPWREPTAAARFQSGKTGKRNRVSLWPRQDYEAQNPRVGIKKGIHVTSIHSWIILRTIQVLEFFLLLLLLLLLTATLVITCEWLFPY
jgi:hypothetical protein